MMSVVGQQNLSDEQGPFADPDEAGQDRRSDADVLTGRIATPAAESSYERFVQQAAREI